MLTLLHGDNLVVSRKELENLKELYRDKEIISLNGNQIEENMLIQSLESSSLFFADRLIILENLLTAKKKINYVPILNRNANQNIILWENKEIGKTVLKNLPKNTVIRLYKYPVLIFKFLDTLFPRNQKASLYLFGENLKKEEPELIFYLLCRQIRLLIQAKENPEGLKISPWQKNNLTKQAQYFTMEQLLSMYKSCLIIDREIKLGLTPFSLPILIEKFIIDFL